MDARKGNIYEILNGNKQFLFRFISGITAGILNNVNACGMTSLRCRKRAKWAIL